MSLSRELFEASFERCGPRLRAWLLTRAPSREDADEVLQRTFECAWRKRDRFTGTDPLPWLFAIASLELRYYRRSRSYEQAHESDTLDRLLDRHLEAADPEVMRDSLERFRRLKDCLERLDPLNRRILALFHGLEEARAGASPTPADPLTDAEVASRVGDGDGKPWSAARIKMRRHRAYEQLHRCYAGEEATGDLESRARPPASLPADEVQPMNSSRPPPGHPPAHQLLELMENPDDPGLEDVMNHLEGCADCQARLDALLEVTDALSAPAFARSLEELRAQEPAPLPEASLKRMRRIGLEEPSGLDENPGRDEEPGASRPAPREGDMPPRLRLVREAGPEREASPSAGREGSAGERPHDPGTSRGAPGGGLPGASADRSGARPGRYVVAGLALAASLLLAVGLWSGRPGPREPLPGGDPSVTFRGEGRTEQGPPARVVLRRADRPETDMVDPIRIEGGRWRVQVPVDAAFQLRVIAPAGAQGWTAVVSCSRPGQGDVPLEPGVTRWTGEGSPALPELVVGRPLNLAALQLKPGERLECSIQRGDEASVLELELTP